MKLHANYHTHTTFCDGSDFAEAVVQEAIRKGFTYLGFSGHMDPGVSMDFQAYTTEICRLQAAYRGRIEILRGVELDNVYDPHCVMENAEYIIGSTHFIPVPGSAVWTQTAAFGRHREGSENWDLIGVDGDIGLLHDQCKKYYDGDFYALSADYYRFEAQVAARLHPTFIGHFDLITRFNDLSREDGGHFLDEQSERYLGPARKAMAALMPYGLPFEINCGAMNRGRKKEVYPRPELLRTLQTLGGEILISADAHQKELLDGGFEEAMDVARWTGFTHTNLLVRGEEADGRNSESRPKVAGEQNALDTSLRTGRRPAKNTNADEGGVLYWQTMEL